MKIYFLLWMFLFSMASQGFAAESPGNLLQALQRETNPEKQHEILLSLGAHYQFFHYDSAMYFHGRAYTIAQQLERNARGDERRRFAHMRAMASMGKMRVQDAHGNIEEVISTANSLLPIALEMKDTVMIASVHLSLGNSNFHLGNFPDALFHYQKVAEIATLAGDDLYVARANQNLGAVFYHQGNYKRAAETTSIASDYFEKLGNTLGLASTRLLLGNLVAESGQPERALKHYQEALQGFEQANHPVGLYNSLLNIGTTYHDLQQYEQARDYFMRANEQAVALNDQTGIARTLYNIGLSYLMMEQSEPSLTYFNQALEIASRHQLKHQMAHTLVSMARAHNNMGRPRQAIVFANQSLELSREIEMISTQESAYRNLFVAHLQLGNLRQALDNHILYKVLSDSVNSMESRVEIARIETQIHNRYLEEQIQLKETELENQRLELQEKNLRIRLEQSQKFVLASGFVALLALTAFIYSNSVKRKKLNELFVEKNRIAEESNKALVSKNIEIARHRDEIDHQKSIIEDKNKSLISSINYAMTIQRSMLPTPKLTKEIFSEHFILFKPKEIVSGDFYWVGKSGNKALLVVADCAGHGVPGAFISIKGLSFLNDHLGNSELSTTGEFLDAFRNYMVESLHQADTPVHQHEVIEMAITMIDQNKGEIMYSGARMPLIIVSEGEVLINGESAKPEAGNCYRIKPDPVGIVYSDNLKSYSTQVIKVQKGSMVYLVTDGFADQFGGPKGERYTFQRLYSLLSDLSQLKQSDQQKYLQEETINWRKNQPQIDDITIFGFRI